jgi:hypothetical protein
MFLAPFGRAPIGTGGKLLAGRSPVVGRADDLASPAMTIRAAARASLSHPSGRRQIVSDNDAAA